MRRDNRPRILIERQPEPYLLLTEDDMVVVGRLTTRMDCTATQAVQRAIRHLDIQHCETMEKSTEHHAHPASNRVVTSREMV